MPDPYTRALSVPRPQPAGIGEMQHRPVANAGAGCGIGRIQQRLQLVAIEIVDQRFVAAFRWNRVHLPGKIKARRNPVFQIPEERLESREPYIARADRVSLRVPDR